ncbi:MAG TPA: oligosaccharide flippase family protein, partial [Candidatus Pacearchaeota archaeon]|nr:oligosaccharide flippase family protein [Candidatus Pacearchaeota archaeon]
MENILKKEGKDLKEIFNRIRKRDFSGNIGIAVRNSMYQLSANIISKVGSVLFTIVLARLLLPELFGLYSLALATILLFATFTDLGINQTVVRFISRSIAQKNLAKAKEYMFYLGKIKFIRVLFSAGALLALSYFISEIYYNKPIFLALVAGSLYLIVTGTISFLQLLLQSLNDFKTLFYREALFQGLRIIVIPLVILFLLKDYSSSGKVFGIISSLVLLWIIVLLLFWKAIKRKILFNKSKRYKFSLSDKKEITKFTKEMFLLGLAGFLLGYVDMIFLGRFISSEFIGFYQIAMGFIGSSIPLIAFSSALFPLFSRLSGKELFKTFNKSVKLTVLISILAVIFIMIFSSQIIKIFYGSAYAPSVNILRVLSLLLLISPMTSLYSSFLIARGNPKSIVLSLGLTTLISLLLSYAFIKIFIIQGELAAVYGICLAVIISNLFYLFSLINCSIRSNLLSR